MVVFFIKVVEFHSVNPGQKHLFDTVNPLLERFGRDFFRAIPARPGVYIMTGVEERILYVGQSKNLRARLASYKNAKPDRAPRKVIRLVQHVKSIVWEECESAASAQLRENELLRLHRPRFNRMNTYPQAYAYIFLRATPDGFELGITRKPECVKNVFGAFKSGYKRALGALVRLLWLVENRTFQATALPASLSDSSQRAKQMVSCTQGLAFHGHEKWLGWLTDYLAGESPELILQLSDSFGTLESAGMFSKQFIAADMEFLVCFYERSTTRNHDLRARFKLDSGLIQQEELDDLLVKE